MSKKITAAITAVGGYVPEDKLTNFDLEKMVDTNDEWITNPNRYLGKKDFKRRRQSHFRYGRSRGKATL